MTETKKDNMNKSLGIFGKTQLQRLFITIQLFNTNGLANHAAAGAFGFLFSAAPTLLLAAFFLTTAFSSSPQAVYALLKRIPFLEIAFDEQWLVNEFLAFSRYGISAILSVLSIFWTGRIFAVSLRRGLTVIFTGIKKRKTVADNLLILFIQMTVFIFAVAMILFSRISLQFNETLDYLPDFFLDIVSSSGIFVLQIAVLWLIPYCAFRIIPANAPSRRSAVYGSFCTMIPCMILSLMFEIIVNQTRYYFLYGALGSLIVLLLNVYFFFIFFFFGAQYAFVTDNFDSFLFAQFRRTRETKNPSRFEKPARKLFCRVEGKLEKFFRNYAKGETIFVKGDEKKEIFYLLEGEVEVVIPTAGNTGSMVTSRLRASFFGEMGHLLSEDRSATVRAKTDVSVLALPPKLFDDILQHDTGLDRVILEELSQRLKNSNEQISVLTARRENH